jgi:hypothetical protein
MLGNKCKRKPNGNREWTIQKNWQQCTQDTGQRQTKQKTQHRNPKGQATRAPPKTAGEHHYTQTNTNNVSVPARNWKWRVATLEKGHFSTSKTEKGQYSYFQLLTIKMSFSTTCSALCINASTWLIVYIYMLLHWHMYRNAVKIWRSIKRLVLKRILVLWMFQIQF